MRIVVCIKQVLDPSAVNNYALAGNLRIAADGRTLDVQAIPRLINAYDEQALEAALRLRDAGCECRITAVSIGRDLQDPLKHCAALGADEIVAIEAKAETLDHHVVANILAAYIRSSGGADLVLCGRQASDDDQGVVPALIGEALGLPIASLARAIELVDGARFPSARDKMAARKKVPLDISVASLGLSDAELTPRVVLAKQYIPEIHGHCEFIEGTPAEAAQLLFEKLRADKLL